MPLIPTYPLDQTISRFDFLLGSDADSSDQTKNYLVGDLVDFLIAELPPSSGGVIFLLNGDNINITGTGLIGDPYQVNVTGIDGSITKINPGANINITGTGTDLDPYQISVTGIDGSITSINGGTNISVTGSGNAGDPYVIHNTKTDPTTDQDTLIGRTSIGNGTYESLTPTEVNALLETETTTQLDTRDTANRNRDNHTGTQLSSTISDLIPTVDSRAGYNNTNWDTAYNKRTDSLSFNTITGDLQIGLGDATNFTQNLDGRFLNDLSAGTNIAIDKTDPLNPIVSLSPAGATVNNYVNDSYRDIGGSTLIGAIDGVNTSFTTSQSAYAATTLMVFLNGQMLFAGNGITETTPATGVFNFETAPQSGDQILAMYFIQSTPVGSGTGDMIGANNLSDLVSANSARINLGLGALATLNQVGTSTLATSAVTNAKLDNMAANTIKGRGATNGTPQDLTAADVRALIMAETTTQLDARDTANRNRLNHTGTQPISSVTDLQNQLNNKLPITGKAADTSLVDGISPSLLARVDANNTFAGDNTFTGNNTFARPSNPNIKVKDSDSPNGSAVPSIQFTDSNDVVLGEIGTTQSGAQHLRLVNYSSGLFLELRDNGDLTYNGNSLLGGNATQTTGTTTLTLNGFATPPTTTAHWVKTDNVVTVSFAFENINASATSNITVTGFDHASNGPGAGESYHHYHLELGTANTSGIVSRGARLLGTTLSFYVTDLTTKNPYLLNNETFGASSKLAATISYITT